MEIISSNDSQFFLHHLLTALSSLQISLTIIGINCPNEDNNTCPQYQTLLYPELHRHIFLLFSEDSILFTQSKFQQDISNITSFCQSLRKIRLSYNSDQTKEEPPKGKTKRIIEMPTTIIKYNLRSKAKSMMLLKMSQLYYSKKWHTFPASTAVPIYEQVADQNTRSV